MNKVIWTILAIVIVAGVAVGAVFFVKKNDAERGAETQAPAANDAAAAGGPESQMPQGTYGDTAVRPGNPVVAKVDGEDITRVDVYNFIRLLPPQVQQQPATQVYPMALDQTINTRLIQNRAEKADLENTPEFQQELAIAKQQIARNVYVEKLVADKVSESDLKKMYDELVVKAPDVEQRKASHILVEDEAKAKEIIKKLGDGANFGDVAKAESTDPTVAQNAGDLGWFSKDSMVPAFAEAVYAMNKGTVSKEPVKSDFGWHVIYLEDVRIQPKPSFEEIKGALEMEKRRQILDEMVEQWRKEAKIEVFDINGDPISDAPPAAPPPAPAPAPAPAPDPAPAPAP